MKSSHRTLLFAGFVSLLVLFSYLVVYRGAQKDEERQRKAALLLEASSDQVQTLELARGPTLIRMERADGGWRLRQPVDYKADAADVDSFVGSVLSEKSLQVIREGSDISWNIYGLDVPEGSLALSLKNGTQSKYVLGSRRTYDNEMYLRKEGENKVYLVSSAWSGYLLRDAKSFRDKQVYLGSAEGVTSFQLRNGTDGAFQMVKDKGAWSFQSGAKGEINQESVKSFLEELPRLRAVDFESEDRNRFTPGKAATFELRVSQGGKDATKEPGKDGGNPSPAEIVLSFYESGDGYSVTSSVMAPVFRMSRSTADRLRLSAGDFRDRRKPFQFKAEDVTRIHYRSTLFSAHLERVSPGKWTVKAGGKAGDEVISEEVERMIKALQGMEARDFVSAAKVRGIGKNEITLKNAQDQVVFSLRWGDTYKTTKQGASTELMFVSTSLEAEGMGVDPSAVRALPGQSLLKPKGAESAKPGPAASGPSGK